ncbi:PepSY domain-containing protein [Gracilibacillus dipsosauri]|nr:PepSY domain-containing protein [Gracilibacillus dipsosauri]
MKTNKWILAVVVGFILGYTIQKKTNQWIKPENALKMAKQKFQQQYDVSGSWIYMKPEQYQIHGLTYDVYHGGITKHVDGQHISLEFFVDAKTGSVIQTKTE